MFLRRKTRPRSVRPGPSSDLYNPAQLARLGVGELPGLSEELTSASSFKSSTPKSFRMTFAERGLSGKWRNVGAVLSLRQFIQQFASGNGGLNHLTWVNMRISRGSI